MTEHSLAEIDKKWTYEPHLRPLAWRWVCRCGRKGRWTYQSEDVAHHAHDRHQGVRP